MTRPAHRFILPLLLLATLLTACALATPPTPRVSEEDPLRARIEQARQRVEDDPGDSAHQVEYARALYLGGLQRPDEPWLEQAIVRWNQLLATHPDEPLVLAYAGSARLVQSRQAVLPWVKGRLAGEGRDLLNQAVQLAPQHAQVRWLRAVTAYQLPIAFGVREQARADFAWLANHLQAPSTSPPAAMPQLEPAMVASVWFHHGMFRQEAGDLPAAEKAWQRAAAAAPTSTAGRAARAQLQKSAAQQP